MFLLFALLAGCAHVPTAVTPEWRGLDYPDDRAWALVQALWREHQAAAGKGWSRSAPVHSGSLLEQWWCSPEVPEDDCWTGVVARGGTRGSAWRGLSVVLAEGGGVEWIAVDSGQVAADDAWGMALTLHVDAESSERVDWGLQVLRYASQARTASVQLGPELFCAVEQSSYTAKGPELDALLVSGRSFAQHAGDAYGGLAATANRAIQAHEARKCAYGRYHGDGSPRCDLVPLNPRDERAALDQVRLEQGHYETLLRADAEALHALLVALYPEALR